MININDLKTILTDSRKIGVKKEVQRPEYFEWLKKASLNKIIKVISGFRRSGKTFSLKQLAKFLTEKQKIPPWNIFFLNFEHDLLLSVKTATDLRNIFNLYLKNLADPEKQIYLFLDEIQKVKNWQSFVRTIYETGQYNIFISGSNSELMAGELSSSLSGRFIKLEVYPFNFEEFLKYQGIQIKNEADYYQQKLLVDKFYRHYLNWGGLPEQFELKKDFKKSYFESLLQKIILDDIVKRYQIKKVDILKEVFQFTAGNVTSSLSLRKMSHVLTNQGVNVSVPTLHSYLKYFETAYALLSLPRFSFKLYSVFEKTKKYYFVDNLLLNFDFVSREKKLENLVAINLIKKFGRENVFFGKEDKGYEVDFVIKNKKGKLVLIQVCLHLTEENKKRELGNLVLANKYLKGKERKAFLIVDQDLRRDKKKGNIKNIVEFLLFES